MVQVTKRPVEFPLEAKELFLRLPRITSYISEAITTCEWLFGKFDAYATMAERFEDYKPIYHDLLSHRVKLKDLILLIDVDIRKELKELVDKALLKEEIYEDKRFEKLVDEAVAILKDVDRIYDDILEDIARTKKVDVVKLYRIVRELSSASRRLYDLKSAVLDLAVMYYEDPPETSTKEFIKTLVKCLVILGVSAVILSKV